MSDTCVRCGSDFWEGKHLNWDPKGPICVDCWEQDADRWLNARERLAWEEFERDLKECDS